MPFKIVRNDITKMEVDAIVNPTNEYMYGTAGVDGTIHQKEGLWLRETTRQMNGLLPGEVKVTEARKLPCKYIFHTFGPIWMGGDEGEENILRNCYVNNLNLALKKGIKSIAFPLIASGTFDYPKDRALGTATAAIGEFLLSHDLEIYLVVYDKKSFVLSEKLYQKINAYIDDHYVRDHNLYINRKNSEKLIYDDKEVLDQSERVLYKEEAFERSIENIVKNLGKPFSEVLIRIIDEKGLTDPEVYKKANVSKQTFWKIKNKENYQPQKSTIVALAIALELNLDESKDLLKKSGYAFSNNNLFDVIVSYFIENQNYNIFEINDVLFEFEVKLLGL